MEGNKKIETTNIDHARILCREAWTAYQVEKNLPKAIQLCSDLMDLIVQENRLPNRREDDLINTLNEASGLK